MEEKLRKSICNYLGDLRDMKAIQADRFNQIKNNSDVYLKRRRASEDSWYYYGYKGEDRTVKYYGKDGCKKINEVKEAHYLKISLEAINNNIKLMERALSQIKDTDYDAINRKLPDTYKNVLISGLSNDNEKARMWKESAEALKASRGIYRPEDLKVTTDDGNKVRSKSEAIIYNYLLSVGSTFTYERPIRVQGTYLTPDFTILSEIDYETEILIEHQGLMDMDYYRSRFGEKVYRYLKDGYIGGINIFYTFDSADGGFDKEAIEMIIRNYVRPVVSATEL